jgi:hypothetical protein
MAGLVGWMDQFAAEGGSLQPTSLAACLDRACMPPGSHAGLPLRLTGAVV